MFIVLALDRTRRHSPLTPYGASLFRRHEELTVSTLSVKCGGAPNINVTLSQGSQ